MDGDEERRKRRGRDDILKSREREKRRGTSRE